METDKKIHYQEYMNREYEEFHESQQEEQRFYAVVKAGDTVTLEKLLEKHSLMEKSKLGRLSEKPLQSFKYHFAISAALTARFCIEGGMQRETAFNLSDMYIQKADKMEKEEAISRLLNQMLMDYANRMKLTREVRTCSKEIWQAIDYIYENLNKRLQIEEVANAVGFHRSHLSRVFKEEMGMNIGDYIRMKKLETAANMLRYSEYEVAQISEIFAFSSQSHFIMLFKKAYGMTPREFRQKRYRSISL